MVPPARRLFLLVLGALVLAVCPASAQEFKTVPAFTWFKLDPEDIFFTDFGIRPGESKNIDIPAQARLTVGFRTDLTPDQCGQLTKAPGWPSHIPKLSDRNGSAHSAQIYGGSSSFIPKNGVAALKFENPTSFPINVVIFTKIPVDGAGTPRSLADVGQFAQSTSPGSGPTLITMRALGHAAAAGDKAALDTIGQIRQQLYKGVDPARDWSRAEASERLMRAAFDEMAASIKSDDASDPAFKMLLDATGVPGLAGFSAIAFGSAAAMDVLQNYGQHHILLSSAVFAMGQPAAAGNADAIRFLIKILDTESDKPLWQAASEELTPAAQAGNVDAKRAVFKYRASLAGMENSEW